MALLKYFLPPPGELVVVPRETLGVHLLKYIVEDSPHKAHRGNLLGSPDLVSFAGGGWLAKVRGRVNEAWHWLETEGFLAPDPSPGTDEGWRYVTDRGWELVKSEADPSTFMGGKYLPMGSLHPRLEEKSRPLYVMGDYDTAVFAAMKCVEVAVRQVTGLSPEQVGVSLIRDAFKSEAESPLGNAFETDAERLAASHLFAGAIGLLKNPSSHREVNITDPIEAVDILRLADLLLRIVDRVKDSEA